MLPTLPASKCANVDSTFDCEVVQARSQQAAIKAAAQSTARPSSRTYARFEPLISAVLTFAIASQCTLSEGALDSTFDTFPRVEDFSTSSTSYSS